MSAFSLVAVARHLLPVLNPQASLITLTYIGATRVMPNYNVMGVAKAALESSVRYLASDLGPRGIRVNAISAGPIKTASARAVQGFSRILEVMEQRAPLRRNTDPDEVADAAVFLASPLARGITGEVLFVDAGISRDRAVASGLTPPRRASGTTRTPGRPGTAGTAAAARCTPWRRDPSGPG